MSPKRCKTPQEKVSDDLTNIKDDLALVQFKLVYKDTQMTHNTMSFLNVPTSKQTDVNITTLSEIVGKFFSVTKSTKKEFLPYNRSILTRIMYD
jgi:hypothetical protein